MEEFKRSDSVATNKLSGLEETKDGGLKKWHRRIWRNVLGIDEDDEGKTLFSHSSMLVRDGVCFEIFFILLSILCFFSKMNDCNY